MNTQMPNINVTSSKAAALPTSPAESFTAEVPFNKMLSKEVSNRNNAINNSTPVSAPDTQPQAKAQTQVQSKPAEAPKDNSAQQPAQASTAAAAAPADTNASKPAKAADADKDADQAKQDDEDKDSTAASAQMLALVANVGQMQQQHVQSAGKKGAEQDMDALANQKGGKKAIGQIGANAKQEHAELQAEANLHGKGKGDMLALGAGAVEGKQMLDKDGGDGKPAVPARNALLGEKGQSGTDALSKNAIGSGPDASALTHNNAKFTLEPAKLKGAEAAPQQQLPTAATVVPGMQQAMSLNQQAAISGHAVERLTPPVGSQGWDQAVGQKMVWMASGGLQSASLTLNPPDLGPLQVVLHVNNDQADATFITAQPEVKQALEAAMPKLREMLDLAGIQLGQATVNTGMPNQQQGANQQQQAQSGSAGRIDGGGSDDTELHVATVPVRRAATGGQGLVDTFA